MIDFELPNPPHEVLRHLADFGADWRESRIPVALRRAGVLGVAVEVDADQFQMQIQAARRSPEFRLRGVVAVTPNGGSRINGRLELSPANRAIMSCLVLVVGSSVWHSSGLVAAVIALGAVAAVIAGLNGVGRTLGEREYLALVKHAAIGIETPAT